MAGPFSLTDDEDNLETPISPDFVSRYRATGCTLSDAYLWRGGEHTSLKQVREDLARYLYLPRIRDAKVLEETVREGVASGEFFGYAQAVTASGRYEGLKLGEPGVIVYLDEQSVLVKPEAARKQMGAEVEKLAPPVYDPSSDTADGIGEGDGNETLRNGDETKASVSPGISRSVATGFHGEVEIDPARLGGSAGAISQEVVQKLTSILGSDVKIKLTIEADVPEGIPENVRRDVSENCNTLKFGTSEFKV